jgi:hypothetical protein
LQEVDICDSSHNIFLKCQFITVFNNATEKATHDDLVAKVEQIMQAKIKLAEAHNDGEREFYENKCASLENAIDEKVYELYNLSEAEIELIKNS